MTGTPPWVLVVVAILSLGGGGALVSAFLIPAQRRQIGAHTTLEITQSAVMYAQELKADLAALKAEVKKVTDELASERGRREAAEAALSQWMRSQGYTRYPGRDRPQLEQPEPGGPLWVPSEQDPDNQP